MPQDQQQQSLRSEEVKDILTKVPNWMIRWGNTLLFIILSLFLALSWLIAYPDVIEASGLITTRKSPQKEYAQLSGKIQHIFVANEELVAPFQDLAVLENTAQYKDVRYLKSILDTLNFTKEAFNFPIDRIPLLFLGEIDGAYANFENSYLAYDHNRQLQPRKYSRKSQQLSAAEIRLRISNLENQKDIQQKELSFEQKAMERQTQLYEKGVISKQEFEQREVQYLQNQRNFKSTENTLSQLRESLSSVRTSISLDNGNSKGEEIRLLRSVIQAYNQLKKAIYDWEKSYVLQSEVDGKVFFLDFWDINQQVSANQLLFSITPQDNKGHLVKLKVPAYNSGKLSKGQKVFLNLDNFPESEFGKLESQVSSISSIPDEEGYYQIEASLDDKLITTYNKEIAFRSEMTGSAQIVTEDLRLLERFLYQLRGILARY